MPLIYCFIKPCSIIHSDCWRAYNQIKHPDPNFTYARFDMDYLHKTVNHSIQYKAPDGIHTNTIEGTWFGLKNIIPNRNQT